MSEVPMQSATRTSFLPSRLTVLCLLLAVCFLLVACHGTGTGGGHH
jgi:hypothetical protein